MSGFPLHLWKRVAFFLSILIWRKQLTLLKTTSEDSKASSRPLILYFVEQSNFPKSGPSKVFKKGRVRVFCKILNSAYLDLKTWSTVKAPFSFRSHRRDLCLKSEMGMLTESATDIV